MEFRTSVRWFSTSHSRAKYQAIPFISKSGKLSLHTFCVWKAYPEQVFFSLVSTVYSRILKILRKRYKYRVRRRLLNCAFKASILYMIFKHDSILDRFLGMTRKGAAPTRAVENFIHSMVCDLDENKRFVYSQAYFQANWLKFQVFRPCDKSSRNNLKVGTHLRNLGFSYMPDSKSKHGAEAFLMSNDMWKISNPRSSDSYTHFQEGSLEYESFLSEPAEQWDSEDHSSEDE